MSGTLSYWDHEELAWAAGFFDGEGSSCLGRKRGGWRIHLSINQAVDADGSAAQVLDRFHAAIGRLGMIETRGTLGKAGKRIRHRTTHKWRTNSFEECQAVLAMLWCYLSENKRRQATRALSEVVKWKRTRGRPGRAKYDYRPRLLLAPQPNPRTEQAWAGGFFDGEGSAYLRVAARRKDGTVWRARRVSVGQKDDTDDVARVLLRFQRAVQGKGHVEIHKAAAAHKWLVDEAVAIDDVVGMLWPFLSKAKRMQIENMQAVYKKQIRQHGTAEICKRGHVYSGTKYKGGRPRKVCNVCVRDLARAKSRRKGAKARIFKNPEERAYKIAAGMYKKKP